MHTCQNCGAEIDESQSFCDDDCQREFEGSDEDVADDDDE